jgi:PAS domain S-box-containing protein
MPSGVLEAKFARAALVAAAAGVALYAVYALAGARGAGIDLVAGWLSTALMAVAALVCAARARAVPGERVAWSLVAGGIGCWAVGDFFVGTVYGGAPPTPSVADAFFVAFYPAVGVAIMLIVRPRLRDARLWLDGLVAGLTLAALMTTVGLSPVHDAAQDGAVALAAAIMYPALDAVLLGLCIGAATMAGFHPGRRWALVGGGLALVAVADTTFSLQIAAGTYESGTIVDALWPAGTVALAASAWACPADSRPPRGEGWTAFVIAAAFTLVGVGVLVVDHYDRVPDIAVWLVAAALAVRVARTALTFGDMAGALRSAQVAAALVESTDLAILRVGTDGTVQTWNPGAVATFRVGASGAVGRPLSDLVAAESRADIDRLLHTAAAGVDAGGPETFRLAGRQDEVELGLRLSPLRDPTGRTEAITVIARDVTERLQAERAERANEAKNRFLSRMSHELRTPLNAVLGFGQLLATRDLDPDAREEVDHILKAGDHLLELINEALEISHIESGRLALTIEPVAVAPLVEEIAGLVSPLSGKRRIGVRVDRPSLDAWVAADPQRLRQVLLNLMSNAIKFNRAGGEVTVRGAAAGTDRFALSVTDTGPGIAPADMARLFDPFERLRADAEGIEGSGLGLALSRGLMEAMDGTIDVVSQPGQGSTFTIALPAAAPGAAEPTSGPLPGLAEAHVPQGGRRSVLCIEDNPQNRDLVEQVFATLDDIDLTTAPDGAGGIERALADPPDLVLLDLHLPDMEGGEVLDRLRADPRTRSVPVVVVSADATAAQIDAMLARGAFDYVTKPIDLGRLVRVVDDALGAASAS